MPGSRPTRLHAALALARAAAATALSRRRPEPGPPPAAVEPPRELAHPCTVTVPAGARADQVFALLVDPARMPDWLLQHDGWVGEPPVGFAGDVRFRQRIRLMGVPSEVRWTVTGVVAGRAVWFEGTAPMGITVGFFLSVTPAENGSVIRFDGGVEGGSADGPLGPMVARNLADAMRKSLAALGRAAAESRRGDSGRASNPQSPPQNGNAGRRGETGREEDAARGRREKPAPIRFERTGTDIDAWTPVIVGAGQVTEHSNEAAGGDPVSLAVRALRLAAVDAGSEQILHQADLSGYVASVSWQYPDGAALIAEAVGAHPDTTVQTTIFGGDGSLRLLNEVAAGIAAGRAGIALIGGAEAASTAAAAERAGRTLDWPVQADGTGPTRTVGRDDQANNDPETAAGLVAPIYLYALIETAVRGRLGLTPDEHRDRITRLWSGFSTIAEGNPHAWQPRAQTPESLATPSAANRMIAAPYPKLLTANLQVNQGTGIIVCSAAAATEAGIAQDRWVFLHAGAHATEEWFVTERADLASSPAIKAVGDAVLGHSGLTIDEVGHVDLYACFPSAVQIAALELGLPLDDPARLTVTGGLTFAGGPGNNYSSHAVANLVPLLRANPESSGLATALGWYLTKHAATVLSARPPVREFRDIDADPRLPRPPARRSLSSWTGPAVVEAFTVPYERSGDPGPAIITALTPAGDRVVLTSPGLDGDPIGWRIDVDGTTFAVADTAPHDLPPPPEPPLTVEWHGPVTVLRLHRPAALAKAIADFEADGRARVAVLTGTDTAFSAVTDDGLPVTTKPLIAAVEGAALAGGCELALAADLIVAAEDAVFGLPGAKSVAGVHLPRAIALETALTGEPLPARRLYDLGLINRVTPSGKALATALELAAAVVANAPPTFQRSR
ncbi:MAG TPA: enoyl-CoA hydratase-related protein [Actinoplanes sp.]|nr:enoyl-CoA hydratase-related protein [Actinoplanes sp.]